MHIPFSTLKKWFILFLLLSINITFAQKNKVSTIAPEFESGWYLPYKGDTIKGEIQTNAGETEAQYNISFFFKPKNAKKVTQITTKKAKAYGFGNRKFEVIKINEIEYFAEVLEKGRVTLYQVFEEKVEKDKKVANPIYYLTDSQADPKSKLAGLVELPYQKPYKKVLKDLFAEQPMLIENIDKWFLQIDQVRNAIQELNKLAQNSSSSSSNSDQSKKQEEEVEVEEVK